MRLSVDKSGKKGVLRLKGALTVNRAADLKKALTRSLKKVKQLLLDCENVIELDVSCLQLLCAAHKTSTKSGGKVTLYKNVPDSVVDIMARSGYMRSLGCIEKDRSECLCQEGGE